MYTLITYLPLMINNNNRRRILEEEEHRKKKNEKENFEKLKNSKEIE